MTVYVTVALVNYSPVQSIIGSVASSHFTKQWGGKVSIGSMSCRPFNHLILRNVELISPANDTICQAHTIDIRFSRFPIDGHGLTAKKVLLKDVYYHLNIDSTGINLKYIFDSFKSDKEKEKSHKEFIVLVDDLVLDNVNYRQDLKDDRVTRDDTVGVDVKHMYYKNISAHFRNIRVNADRITCRIDHLSTVERSGLEVRDIQMNVYATRSGISATNMHIETADSKLMGDVLMDFDSWKTMKHFLDSVYFYVHFTEGSYGGMRDAGYWAHTLWGLDQRVDINGYFSGPVQDMHTDRLHLAFGDETELDLDGYIYGLPNIDTTLIGATIHRLHTTYSDLETVSRTQHMPLHGTKALKAMDVIDVEATFTGTIRDFFATLNVTGKPGTVSGDVVLAMDPKNKDFRYVGQLSSEGFQIGGLLPNEWITRSGFDVIFEGTGFDPKTMNSSLNGTLHHSTVRGHRMTGNSTFEAEAADGVITAEVKIDDPVAALDLSGEVKWRDFGPDYKAAVTARHLNLTALKLWEDTTGVDAIVDADIDARYFTTNSSSSYGRVTLRNTSLRSGKGDINLQSAVMTARERYGWKNVALNSDVLNLQMRGYFNYDGLPMTLRKFLKDYLPHTYSGDDSEEDYGRIADSRFEINATWLDTTRILQMFVPNLMIAGGSTLQTNYNFEESFKPIVRSDSIGWGSVRLYNMGLNGEGTGDRYRMRITSDDVKVGNLLIGERCDVGFEGSKDDAVCQVSWRNSSDEIGDGNINFRLLVDSSTMRLVVDPSQLDVGDEIWRLVDFGSENYMRDGEIHVGGLGLVSGDQSVSMTMMKTGSVNDSIEVLFRDFGMNVLNPFLASQNLTVDGTANGKVNMGVFLRADLNIDSLVFDGEKIGDTRVQSTWNSEMNQLNLYVVSDPVLLTGYVNLDGEDKEIKFDASLYDFGLKSLQPLVSSFSSAIGGEASGDFTIGGTIQKPVVEGYLSVDKGVVNVDFLNVPFFFSDTIWLDTSAIRLDRFVVKDKNGNEARIDGKISHNHLKDINLDLKLKSDKLMCMNTTARQNELYYGTVIVSVDGLVKGPADDIDIVLNARTLNGTTLNVPINDQRQLQEADYIHFVSDKDDIHIGRTEHVEIEKRQPTSMQESKNHYLLTINVETTPEMQTHLPMDFSSVEAVVKAYGSGDLQLQVGSDSPFTLIGDYEMLGGTVSLDILGVLSKVFSIDEGSSITFPGRISDALFDIKAVYSQRVNLSSLTGTLSSTESQKQVQVENVIALSGTLQAPDINFDLRLPNADQSVQEEVFAYIDRNNERDMLNQTVSLLLLKKFYSTTSSNGIDNGGNMADEVYGTVANTLGSMVSDMVQFVNVNFEYTAGNALTTDQYALDISKEWNKFYFETSLGFGGEAREMSTAGNNNNMTGDMLVGYKINPRLHLFVFNRSNTNDYTRSDLPYKQGLGVKYTQDFDKFSDLFRRKNRNR